MSNSDSRDLLQEIYAAMSRTDMPPTRTDSKHFDDAEGEDLGVLPPHLAQVYNLMIKKYEAGDKLPCNCGSGDQSPCPRQEVREELQLIYSLFIRSADMQFPESLEFDRCSVNGEWHLIGETMDPLEMLFGGSMLIVGVSRAH